jgi:hypothetical protein
MAKSKRNSDTTDNDGAFILKLVLYVLLGSMWLKIHSTNLDSGIPIPVGLVLGIIFSSHEHFRIDRKIEYGVLIIAALIGLMVPYGLFIGF